MVFLCKRKKEKTCFQFGVLTASRFQFASLRILTGPSADICLSNPPGCSLLTGTLILQSTRLVGGHESNYNVPHLLSAGARREPRTLRFSVTVLCMSSACWHRSSVQMSHDWRQSLPDSVSVIQFLGFLMWPF